jgi:hypothetical protein
MKRQETHSSSVRINDHDRTALEIGVVLAKNTDDHGRCLCRKDSVRPQLDDAWTRAAEVMGENDESVVVGPVEDLLVGGAPMKAFATLAD